MRNDFSNKDFWQINDEHGNKQYYLRINGQWMQVTKEIYSVYKNSYQKMYRDRIREKDKLKHYENIDDFFPYMKGDEIKNPLQIMIEKDMIAYIQNLIGELSLEEQIIINSIYYKEMSERELAKQLHMSQQKLHYRKKRILKKLKHFLSEDY